MNKTLGILGGGQLGRMSALAAARLGIKTHILCPETDAPASHVAARTFIANYDNHEALQEFAASVDVISYEFENIPVETIRYLKNFKPVYPDDKLLEISQHRWAEKQFLNDTGIQTAKWAQATGPDDIHLTLKELGASDCIIKTTRLGYDGKGQAKITKDTDIDTAWQSLKTDEAIIESLVPFLHEISVIVARDIHGKTKSYTPVLNEHKNHILSRTIAPAPLDPTLLDEATGIAHRLAEQVGLVGILGLELFVTKDNKILANEIAPRPHNSGHWTIDACTVSQFENHVRCVCGLPVGDTTAHSSAEMLNLIGDEVEMIKDYLEKPNTSIHLYGKPDVRPGRKMGHITILK